MLDVVNAGDGTTRWTPYMIAQMTEAPVGSVTAACNALVRDGRIVKVGERPFMVKSLGNLG